LPKVLYIPTFWGKKEKREKRKKRRKKEMACRSRGGATDNHLSKKGRKKERGSTLMDTLCTFLSPFKGGKKKKGGEREKGGGRGNFTLRSPL